MTRHDDFSPQYQKSKDQYGEVVYAEKRRLIFCSPEIKCRTRSVFIFKMIDDEDHYILRIQSPYSGIPEREVYWEVLFYGNRQLLSYVNIINSVYGLSPSIESYILYMPKGFNS